MNCYLAFFIVDNAGWSSLEACLAHNQKVTGSNPVPATSHTGESPVNKLFKENDMKNILTILKELGIEVPKEKEADLDKAVAENYKTVADYDKQKEKLDAANKTIEANDTAMKELQTKLDGFKDVDVSGLNQRIKDLETEKSNIQKDYDAKIADRDFDDLVKESIAAVKGKNAKAITALLDVDTLKVSKNQKEDIAAALKVLTEKEDSKMLFGEPDPKPAGTGNLIGQVRGGSGTNAEEAAMRAAMGLPPVPETK